MSKILKISKHSEFLTLYLGQSTNREDYNRIELENYNGGMEIMAKLALEFLKQDEK